MASGKIKYWNDEKGFGYIESEQYAGNILAHVSEVKGKPLKVGDTIVFTLKNTPNGMLAQQIYARESLENTRHLPTSTEKFTLDSPLELSLETDNPTSQNPQANVTQNPEFERYFLFLKRPIYYGKIARWDENTQSGYIQSEAFDEPIFTQIQHFIDPTLLPRPHDEVKFQLKGQTAVKVDYPNRQANFSQFANNAPNATNNSGSKGFLGLIGLIILLVVGLYFYKKW